jgi:hypothetical protein
VDLEGVEVGSFSIYSLKLAIEGATGAVASSRLRHLVPTESRNIAAPHFEYTHSRKNNMKILWFKNQSMFAHIIELSWSLGDTHISGDLAPFEVDCLYLYFSREHNTA